MAKKLTRKTPSAHEVIEGLVDQVERQFRELQLPAPVVCEPTASAQARLDAACTTVNNVLLTMRLSRAVDRAVEEKALRGRLKETHVDLLRAAIVFAGAGLDATLKELIRTTVRQLAQRSDVARRRFIEFVQDHLAASDAPINRKRLAEVLASPDGTQAELLDRYERDLTGDSLQSAQQVDGVCSALGITDADLRKRLRDGSTLDQMFRARNAIVHELDLTARGRQARPLGKVEAYSREALAVTQEIVNAVARLLRG